MTCIQVAFATICMRRLMSKSGEGTNEGSSANAKRILSWQPQCRTCRACAGKVGRWQDLCPAPAGTTVALQPPRSCARRTPPSDSASPRGESARRSREGWVGRPTSWRRTRSQRSCHFEGRCLFALGLEVDSQGDLGRMGTVPMRSPGDPRGTPRRPWGDPTFCTCRTSVLHVKTFNHEIRDRRC